MFAVAQPHRPFIVSIVRDSGIAVRSILSTASVPKGCVFWGRVRGLRMGDQELLRTFDISIKPRPTPYGAYSLDLIPVPPKRSWPMPNNHAYAYDNRAELSDALDRLGIPDAEKTSILCCLDRGSIYRIISLTVPDEVAATLGVTEMSVLNMGHP